MPLLTGARLDLSGQGGGGGKRSGSKYLKAPPWPDGGVCLAEHPKGSYTPDALRINNIVVGH